MGGKTIYLEVTRKVTSLIWLID